MKFPSFIALAGVSVSLASPVLQSRATFEQIVFEPPLNWLTGSTLYPSNIIAGYNAEISKYNATSWAAYILAQCETYTACTSTSSYSGNNSGSTGGRFWFGEVYRGGPTNTANYERETSSEFGITDSVAYTIVV